MASNIEMLSLKLAGAASGAHPVENRCTYSVNVVEKQRQEY